MIKDVLINIKGTQGLDEQIDTIELTTDGKFGIKDGQYFLSYDEGQILDTYEEIKTNIFIKSETSVVLQRNGAINSRMLIEKDMRNTCYYSTPHGDLVIGIFGEDFSFKLDENGGEIKLRYTIDSNLQLLSRNEVNISVREVK